VKDLYNENYKTLKKETIIPKTLKLLDKYMGKHQDIGIGLSE
jgi:hypothetical protein